MFNNKINFEELSNILKINKEQVDFRSQSFDRFHLNGFPSKKIEDWKFIDLNKIIKSKIPDLKFFNKLVTNKKSKSEILKYLPFKIEDENYILSVNGFISDISLRNEDQNKFEIIKNPEIIKPNNDDTLELLNNALYLDYIKLIVRENYKFIKPIIFINVSSPDITDTNINQRFDVLLEKNSSLSVLDLNLNNSLNSFLNINNNFVLQENSILKNYKIDLNGNSNLYYSKTKIDLYKNSISENFILTAGSEFAKNEIVCNLKENYCSAFVNGIINLKDSKQHEIRSKINHLSENTKSYQLIKAALKDKSRAVYQGKIYVDSVSQKTDGYQLSKAILLNEGTEFNAKPELEIYADDVKCSHGSSSGNLDENKIFYLMTRGLNKNEAKQILLDGFFLEVIEKITNNRVKNIIKLLMNIR
tara:strand:+ start:202 stop:1452 length:1251 start_codon:yes stop_codon:yes gene_type:complete